MTIKVYVKHTEEIIAGEDYVSVNILGSEVFPRRGDYMFLGEKAISKLNEEISSLPENQRERCTHSQGLDISCEDFNIVEWAGFDVEEGIWVVMLTDGRGLL